MGWPGASPKADAFLSPFNGDYYNPMMDENEIENQGGGTA
jgi:hypothetical protein